MPNTRNAMAATHHFVNKALGGIAFPTTAEEIIAEVGGTLIPLNNSRQVTLAELMSDITPRAYPCAAAFYCALSAFLLVRDKCWK